MAEFVQNGEVLEIIDSKTRNGTFWRVKVLDQDTGDEDQFGMGKEKPDFGEGSIISFEFEESDDGKYLNMLVDTLEIIDEVKPKGRSSRGGRDGGGRGNSSRGGRGNSRNNDDDDNGRGSRSSRGGSSSRGSSRSGGSGSKSGSSRSNRSSGGSSEKKSSGKKEVDWETKDRRIELMSARNSALEEVKIAVELGAFPLGTKTTKAADKFALLQQLVDQETARFLEQNEAYIADGIDAICDGEYGDGDEDE